MTSGPQRPYSYAESIKSGVSDELINTWLMRPIAGMIVRVLYDTPVTPNQVTIASMVAGLFAAFFYLGGSADSIAVAGLLVTLKDVLDSADGQLARAKNRYTRIGRFLDSIGDFIVSAAVFGAIGWTLYESSGEGSMFILAMLGLAGITLRVSYHVFYHTSFLHLENTYANNRITEEVKEMDATAGANVLLLQRIFQTIYGWQDAMMVKVDEWCREGQTGEQFFARWYSDVTALRISGLLGLGTELFVLTVCSLFNRLELYLYLNLFLMNGVWMLSVAYRRMVLKTMAESP